jgi:hypothetical protein
MEDENVTQTASHTETCLCRDLGTHIAGMFGIKSEGAKQHLRNARIEVLKAVRTLIDKRIEYLSRTEHKGTRLTVE